MVTVGVDDGSLQADSQPKSAGLVFSLHSLNEPSELLQWPCHDDNNININNIIHDYYYYYKYDWSCLLSLYLITQEHGSVEPLLV